MLLSYRIGLIHKAYKRAYRFWEMVASAPDPVMRYLERLLSDPLRLLSVLGLLFVIALNLYHFSFTANQPIWWDEGDYLALAKEFALPSAEQPEWWGHFADIRPLFMPFVWSLFIRLSLPEALMRFVTEILPPLVLPFSFI